MKYYEFNNAPGKPLINLAYANGFPPQTYHEALKPLFDRYHVVALAERPLWGDCPPESIHAWQQFGDDLLDGLASLTDQPIIGIGHSFGGVATTYAAIKRPERFSRLVLIDPTFLPPHWLLAAWLTRRLGIRLRQGLIDGALRRRRTWDSTEVAYEYFRSKRLFARSSDAVVRAYAESITAPGDDGSVHLVWTPEWEAQIYRTLATDVWTLPRRIKQPLMVLRGEASDTFLKSSAALFHLLNPRANMIDVSGAGHLVPQDQPEQVGKLIAEFLG